MVTANYVGEELYQVLLQQLVPRLQTNSLWFAAERKELSMHSLEKQRQAGPRPEDANTTEGIMVSTDLSLTMCQAPFSRLWGGVGESRLPRHRIAE